MGQKKVVMYVEIGCFLSCISGWILTCSTLATEYWVFSEVGSVALTTGNFYSNLWMDCLSDTTGVSDCKYYPSMMGLSAFLHVSRALAVVSVILGFWATVLSLIGMKCTKIGGSELVNAKITFAASLTYITSGFCGMIVYSWWGNKVRTDFLNPYYLEIKYEFGAALFIGWGGSCLMIFGSGVMAYFSAKESFLQSKPNKPRRPPTFMTTRTGRTGLLADSSRPTTVIVPSQLSKEGSRSDGSREKKDGRISKIAPPFDSAV